MHTKKSSRAAWEKVRSGLNARGKDASARIPRGVVPHPRDAGARPTATMPVGQMADHALDAEQGPPLIIREFPDRFEAAIDGIRTTARIVEMVEEQPKAAMYFGAALLGGAIGSSLSQKKEGVLVGVGLGLLFAAAMDAAGERRGT